MHTDQKAEMQRIYAYRLFLIFPVEVICRKCYITYYRKEVERGIVNHQTGKCAFAKD